LAFGFEPLIVVEKENIEGWSLHKEYTVTTTLRHAPTGTIAGMGVGFCSSMEKKYRYRSSFKILDDPIPGDYRENKKVYAQKGFFCKKIENTWCWCESDGEGENPDIADVLNTVLKMAKKRSFVDAVLTATCASHVFTQDIEDMQGVIDVVVDQNGDAAPVAEAVEKAEQPPMPAASMDNILTQEARDLVLEAFKKMDVPQAQLEQEVEVELADWTEAHAAHFRALWSRVSDGHLLSTQIGAGLPE
jgi:uncharacterized protein YhfF